MKSNLFNQCEKKLSINFILKKNSFDIQTDNLNSFIDINLIHNCGY